MVLVLATGTGFPARNKIPDWANELLENADDFELLSLDPSRHPYIVLGKTPLKDVTVRKNLISAFRKGVEENQDTVAACFNPRHKIHVRRGHEEADFVICFECAQVYVYGSDERKGYFLISGSPQPVFDKILREAGVPLSKRPGE